MWDGKKKAITFSFDDGVTQDIRLVEIFNKYGLKCTFNINSSFFGLPGKLDRNNQIVAHNKIPISDVRRVYEGHEVAAHTLTHPCLTRLDESTIIYQVEEDRKRLSDLFGYEVVGMAYPCGDNDNRVVDILKKHTGIKYARTVTSTYAFDKQENLLQFNPSVYYIEDSLERVVDEFLAMNPDKPQLLYICGHSYEMDANYISWEHFESICKKIANRKDIYYGTNKNVLIDEN